MNSNKKRYLGMPRHSHKSWLDIMNNTQYQDAEIDCYNKGPLFYAIETRVAELLGKPQAMFFNKGTTCQLAALKTICTAANNNTVILHPNSHIAVDEQNAYIELMGLNGILIGDDHAPFLPDDLNKIKDNVAALTIELPLRRAGFKLTPWDQLVKMRQWCDSNKVHFHLDGARLWESAPYYQKSLSEICSLFDSVYVSLYKGIGGISGALLAGTEDFLLQCDIWRNRLGSNMYSAFPALITGLAGLDKNLPLIPQWVRRAQEISKALSTIEQLIVEPAQSNGFQVKIRRNSVQLNHKLDYLQGKYGLVLCNDFAATMSDPEIAFTEIQVGINHEQISNDEILGLFQELSKS